MAKPFLSFQSGVLILRPLLTYIVVCPRRLNPPRSPQAFHRMRHRYRQLLQEEIAHTVAVPDNVEDELRQFIAVLQA